MNSQMISYFSILNKHEELNYWFSEVITNHWKNPERNIPNYKVKDDFWKSRNVEKIPYRRGAIFAFWLDNQIILKTNYKKPLDDLMRELLKACKERTK